MLHNALEAIYNDHNSSPVLTHIAEVFLGKMHRSNSLPLTIEDVMSLNHKALEHVIGITACMSRFNRVFLDSLFIPIFSVLAEYITTLQSPIEENRMVHSH